MNLLTIGMLVWNLLHYEISITPSFATRSLKGENRITFHTLTPGRDLTLDLLQPMRITAARQGNTTLAFTHDGDRYIIHFPRTLPKNYTTTIEIQFEGVPHEASPTKAPFESGWIWTVDDKNRPWAAVACEGTGAAIWLPCKRQLYDKPDSGITLHITVPDTLTAIGNGRLTNKRSHGNGTTTWTWTTKSPISDYNIIPYIGKYARWEKTFPGQKGPLDCQYWALDYNLQKAQQKFQEVDTMLRAFEYWMGPYPFYKDGYKLVEAPMYGGMEHQSNIAYGNKFKMGLEGRDLSSTGLGLKWDFIIVHESGHEWFGNNITGRGDTPSPNTPHSTDDDSWIHEGFTKYTEVLYVEYVYGSTAAETYYQGLLHRIKNDRPAMQGSSDKYYKGAAFLHAVRHLTGDTTFRALLHNLNSRFYHQSISTTQILTYMNTFIHHNLTPLFDQYMRTTKWPIN